jgi:predicted ATPase/DNA-binding winged helix-turn-helix (wHTH) protein
VPDQPRPPVDRIIAFGPFRLFPGRQLLLDGEKPLRIGTRALDILTILVDQPGAVISKEELVGRVWPNIFVEEGNLRVHMAALRRALGDGQGGNRYVVTVPGRGYCFVAPVAQEKSPEASAPQQVALPEPAHNLPVSLKRMVGRSAVVAALVAQLPERRFITVVGSGGIGKTTVALAAADELSTSYPDGARFIDLAPVADPALVPSALASVLGIAIRSGNALPGLIAFLREKQMLLVLDSCERAVEAVAALVEEVHNRAPGVHILATSREPLRAQGERVQRLQPLDVPPASGDLTVDKAMTYSAVQLFVERATASADDFRLTNADAPVVADICRRLDGIALAIELAAGRVEAFGLRGLAERLDDRFRLLTRGRRTALPRHQTLTATLDWSYELLPEAERVVLRRLAVFAGPFSLDSANAIASSADIAASDVAECVANLVGKSLVTAEFGGPTVSYRLFETTRAYAEDKLAASGELPLFSKRHAEYFTNLLRRADLDSHKLSTAEWLSAYGAQIDDVRAALDWAFSGDGDADLGIALTIVAVPLWLQLSLMEECHRHVERALAHARSSTIRDARRDMQLSAALGSVLVYTNVGPAARAAWTNALETAESLHDIDYKLRSLWGLWVDSLNNGAFQEAVALARRFYSTAAGSADPSDLLMGDRIIGIALHFLGDEVDARRHIDRMLDRYVSPIHASHIIRFQFDQRLTARAFQARCQWLLGQQDQALCLVETTVEQVQSSGHVLSICNVLGQGACPVALWSGDLAAAERYLQLLLDYSATHTLGLWHAWGLCFRGVVLIKRGDRTAGLDALRSVLDEVPEIRSLPRYLGLLGELADAMGESGEVAQALMAIDGAIERSQLRQERWCFPELLRIKGELVLREAKPEASKSALGYFQQALDLARAHSVLSWELRAATSFARWHRDHANAEDGRSVLAAVYSRFPEEHCWTNCGEISANSAKSNQAPKFLLFIEPGRRLARLSPSPFFRGGTLWQRPPQIPPSTTASMSSI